MSNIDTRQAQRGSLFLLAQLRVEGSADEHRVKLRNLSARGMMAEGPVRVSRGELVSVELRGIGWVEGSVAWKQDTRFGIAFVEEIDPAKVRIADSGLEPAGVSEPHVRATKRPSDKQILRKV
jgi:hypothetical protein